jgi:hypothetical protein
MGIVINFTGITKLDLPPDRLLEAAVGKLDGCLILGFDSDGDFYAASSYADGGTVLWLMEQCKKRLLEGAAEIARDD